jgi:hypothetical protein
MPSKGKKKPTVVVTVVVPDGRVEKSLREAEGVVQVYGDAQIGPF